MPKPNQSDQIEAIAGRLWSRKEVKDAFHLFLLAAKSGNSKAMETVGYFYDDGVGVKAEPEEALYWYRKAARRGSQLAANNIGVIWRDRGDYKKALRWFKEALRLGDGDANLLIAKIYLGPQFNRAKAQSYLRRTCRAKNVTKGSIEEARQLLRELARG